MPSGMFSSDGKRPVADDANIGVVANSLETKTHPSSGSTKYNCALPVGEIERVMVVSGTLNRLTFACFNTAGAVSQPLYFAYCIAVLVANTFDTDWAVTA